LDFTPITAAQLNPPLNVTLIRDVEGLAKLRDFFARCGGIVGWDIETDPKKGYFWRRTRTIQFGNQQEQYVIDLLPFFDNSDTRLFNCQGHYGLDLPASIKPVIETIQPVVCSKDYLKVGVNLGFEYENFYWQFGLRPWNFFDCSIVERCIWAGAHSMKDYGFYSMEEMMNRYFLVQIDKSLQESFTLDQELTWDQVLYAALDTRFPLAVRQVQLLILQGETYDSLKRKGSTAARFLKNIDAATGSAQDKTEWSQIVTGDNLVEIAKIENDAIGAFQDMHVHGERLDRVRWLERVAAKRLELKRVIHEELDPVFIPIVGRKSEVITDEEIAAADAKWKSYNAIPEAETAFKPLLRMATKAGKDDQLAELEGQLEALKAVRIAEKVKYKALCSELKKRRTAIRNLAEKCEGEALINYGSKPQLMGVLTGMKGLKTLKDTEDGTLERFEHIPVISALRKYRTLDKEVGTYGEQWVTEWKTKPSGDEGWLHPGDGRLHCTFNQMDAATGRSTSDNPNGQNLPRDKEVRSCFIADPPDESIRISVCCQEEAYWVGDHFNTYVCPKCNNACETDPEEYIIVTADMSGAELRILADLANEPVWINAFNRDEDVHCVCVELMDEETWPKLALPGCFYYEAKADGTLRRKRCKCPEHNELRDNMKPMNFGIPYGISVPALAKQLKKPEDLVAQRLAKHKQKFPRLWEYIDNSGMMAKMKKKAFDMFGRRRLFVEPTWERAKAKAKVDKKKQLELPKEERDRNKANFIALHGRKPDKEELWHLTHRLPTNKEIASAFKAMHGSIERQGKNHEIQGTNATIAKQAMGCGFCPAGKPYLWHTLPQYKAKLIKFIHDELVIQCPKRFGQQVAALIGDAFKRAAAEKMKKVAMEFEFKVAPYWKK
jgi:DNA polymerase I-like protein with 3'-5' exonuclease and polymerase domains